MRPDLQHAAGPKPLDEALEIAAIEGNAPCGRGQPGVGHVHEDRAAVSAYAGALVMAEDDDQIVEMIVSPEDLGTRRIGMADGPIVVAVAGIVAPAIARPDRANRERRSRACSAIGTVKNGADGPSPDGRGAVTFAFQSAATCAA